MILLHGRKVDNSWQLYEVVKEWLEICGKMGREAAKTRRGTKKSLRLFLPLWPHMIHYDCKKGVATKTERHRGAQRFLRASLSLSALAAIHNSL